MKKMFAAVLFAAVMLSASALAPGAEPATSTDCSDCAAVSQAQLADLLEVDKSDLADKSGKDIYNMLVAANKIEQYKQLWLNAAENRLDALVSEGTLTREKAEAKYNKFADKLDDWNGAKDINKLFSIISK